MCGECSIQAKVAAVVVVVLLGIGGLMIGLAFNKLSTNEVGLDYSHNSETINFDKLYGSGVHFLGVGHEFIKFNTKVKELDLRGEDLVTARTVDGLRVDLQGRILYRLNSKKESLASLHLMFGGDHDSAYRRIARSAIRDVAGKFTAFTFWRNRAVIAEAINTRLSTLFADYHAKLDSFLLTNFELPAPFQDAITETDVRLQEKEAVQFEESTVTTETRTRVLRAEKDADIIRLEANATATSFLLNVDAELVRIRANVDAEVAAYTELKSQLNLTSAELISYVWFSTLETSKSEQYTKLVSFERPPGVPKL